MSRGEIVKEVMKKYGISLADASKVVKEKGLYKAKEPTATKTRSDLKKHIHKIQSAVGHKLSSSEELKEHYEKQLSPNAIMLRHLKLAKEAKTNEDKNKHIEMAMKLKESMKK
jgi:hypothetical protein